MPLCRRRHRRSAVTPYSTRGDFDLRDIPILERGRSNFVTSRINARSTDDSWVNVGMSPIKRAASKYSLRRLGRKTVARAVLGASVRASTETEERDGDPRPRRRDRGAAPFPRVHVPRRASVGGDAGAPPSPAFRILTLAPRNRPPSPPSPIGSSAGARPPRVAPGVVARPRRPRRRSRTSRREQTPLVRSSLGAFPPTPSRPSRPIPAPTA